MHEKLMPHSSPPPSERFSGGSSALWHGLIILLPVVVAVVAMTHASSVLLDIVFHAIADAYIQVSAFVAGTFFLFYGVERWLKIDATEALRDAGKWQVPVSAALGALPGCGGAIIVVTQYVFGRLWFGRGVAGLAATMGGAALLVLAQEPLTGVWIFSLGFVVGTNSGLVGQGPSRR